MSAMPVTTPAQGARPIITQERLREFARLRRMVALHATMREQLLEMLDRGAPIESGPMRVQVRTAWHRRLTVKSLSPILGDLEVARLRDLVTPTEHRQLIVKGRAGRKGRKI